MFACTGGGQPIIVSLRNEIHSEAGAASTAALACIDTKMDAAFTRTILKAIVAHDTAKARAMQATLSACVTGAH
jgi:hypothetical protein